MSSINAAKKRRANIVQPVMESQQQTQQQPPNRNLMSLPQVLKVFDTRLNAIESNVNDLKSSPTTETSDSKESSISIATEMQEILGEYEERFQVLANEIQIMKEIVLKLQTYTMDVNKTLLEERVQMMSSATAKETIEMTEAPKTSTPEVLSNEEDELNVDELNLDTNTQNDSQPEEEFTLAVNNKDKKKKKKGGH